LRINQVVVIPSLSRDEGFGRFTDGLFESQVISAYVEAMVERLDEDRVRYTVQKKDDLIMPNSLVIYCSAGWGNKDDVEKPNFSKVTIGQSTSRKACEFVNEVLVDWGKCYAHFLHSTKEVTNSKEVILKHKDTIAVKIEPFLMNGCHTMEYAKNLTILGDMLAQAVVEFLSCRDEMPRLPSMYK